MVMQIKLLVLLLLTVADEILGQSEPAPPLKQNPMPIDGIVFFFYPIEFCIRFGVSLMRCLNRAEVCNDHWASFLHA